MEANQDINWLKTTANDLNNLLQVITESSNVLEPLCTGTDEGRRYYEFLRNSLTRATNVTSELVGRLGGGYRRSESVSAPSPAPGAAPNSAKTTGADATPISNPEGKRELIMLVDDEEMVRRIVTTVLVRADYRVVAAADPFRALDAFKKLRGSIDLIILDFTLPIMDGSELFDELRQMDPNVVVMLSSGFAEQAKIGAMLARGLRGFLPKPYTEAKLLEQVRSTLDAVRSGKTGERRVL